MCFLYRRTSFQRCQTQISQILTKQRKSRLRLFCPNREERLLRRQLRAALRPRRLTQPNDDGNGGTRGRAVPAEECGGRPAPPRPHKAKQCSHLNHAANLWSYGCARMFRCYGLAMACLGPPAPGRGWNARGSPGQPEASGGGNTGGGAGSRGAGRGSPMDIWTDINSGHDIRRCYFWPFWPPRSPRSNREPRDTTAEAGSGASTREARRATKSHRLWDALKAGDGATERLIAGGVTRPRRTERTERTAHRSGGGALELLSRLCDR